MKHNRLMLISAAVAVLAAGRANAVTYSFDFTDTTTSMAAALTVTAPSIGSPATAVSGTFGGLTVTGLSNWDSADNVLTLTAPYVSFGGFAFTTSDSNTYNLYNDGGSTYIENIDQCPLGSCYPGGGTPYDVVTVGSFTPASPVPEPASIVLLGAGIVAAFAAARRRRAG